MQSHGWKMQQRFIGWRSGNALALSEQGGCGRDARDGGLSIAGGVHGEAGWAPGGDDLV